MKILYLGASELQLPAINLAVKNGLDVIVVDRNMNHKLKKIVKEFICCDVNDFKGILERLEKSNINNVFCFYGIADYAYRSIYKICKYMNIKKKEVELFKTLSNKRLTYKALEDKRVLIPKVYKLSEINFKKNKKKFPLIIKDAKGYNSYEVRELKNKEELKRLNKFHDDNLIVQKKINGKVFNIDIIYLKNKIINHAYTERFFHKNFLAKYSIEYKQIEKYKKYFDLAKRICSKLGVINGPVTLDFIEKNKKIYFLEISQHIHSVYLNEISGRLNNLGYWFSDLTNSTPKYSITKSVEAHVGYYNIYNSDEEIKKNSDILNKLCSLYKIYYRKGLNTKKKNSLYSIIFLKNKNHSLLLKDIRTIKKIFKNNIYN